MRDGELAGVIDFGDLAAGDPATDLAIGWMLLPFDVHSRLRLRARDPRRGGDGPHPSLTAEARHRKTQRAAGSPAAPHEYGCDLDGADVLGFLALAAGSDVELDQLTLVEGLVAGALDVREVNEHVVSTVS